MRNGQEKKEPPSHQTTLIANSTATATGSENKSNKPVPILPERLPSNRPHWADSAIAIFTFLILITYISANYFQWKQSKQTETALHLDQRAWIDVSFGMPVLKENSPISVPITVTNTGKTAAKTFEGYIVIASVKREDEPLFGGLDKPGEGRVPMRVGILLPNRPTSVMFVAVKPGTQNREQVFLTPSLNQEIQNGQSVILAYGRINYTDIFGTKHWIKFCGSHGALIGVAPKKCSSYNDIDND